MLKGCYRSQISRGQMGWVAQQGGAEFRKNSQLPYFLKNNPPIAVDNDIAAFQNGMKCLMRKVLNSPTSLFLQPVIVV